MKKLCILLVLSLSLTVSGCSLEDVAQIIDTENSRVEIAKSAILPGYATDITLGQALDAYFTNPEWKVFTAQSGENVIQCSGSCVYDGKTVNAIFQFVVNGNGEVLPYSLQMDGELQTGGTIMLVLLEAYGCAAEKIIENFN